MNNSNRHTGRVLPHAIAGLGMLVLLWGCSQSQPENSVAPEPAPSNEAANESTSAAPDAEPGAAAKPQPVPVEPEATPADEEKLPEVRAVDTDELASLIDDAEGRIAVLNIWATWCPPCVAEMPDLVQFYKDTNRDDVAFISLSVDGMAAMDDAIPEFQRDHAVPFPIYILSERDDEGLKQALRGPFDGIVPVTIVFDREGGRAQTFKGAVTDAMLHQAIDGLAPEPS